MKFSIDREAFLTPLLLVSGVVERRQTLPVLSNLLCVVDDTGLTLTGSDQEVELSSRVAAIDAVEPGEVTIPARKLVDICRSLPANARIDLDEDVGRISIRSGRFKSHLATLPSIDFPKVEMEESSVKMVLSAGHLNMLLEKTSFAMAQQDVRYFFNGMLFEIEGNTVRAVATNGQRLATTEVATVVALDRKRQFIVPHKGVGEIFRLVKEAQDEDVQLELSDNHLRCVTGNSSLVTKLIDGVYPDYKRAIPLNGDKVVTFSRLELKEALRRIAILSNEMYRNVKLFLSSGELRLHANNPLQEEAEEFVTIDYTGEDLEIGFNVGYLIDVLSALEGDKVTMVMSDSNSAILLTDPEVESSRFVVSPMML